jgi:hypothetical protein
VTSVAQSACLRDIKGIRADKTIIESVVVTPPLDTIFNFRATYHSKSLPLKYGQLVFLLFGQHPRLPTEEQDWADQGIVNDKFWPERRLERCCFSRLTSFVGGIRDSRYKNSLTTTNCFSPIATLYPTSRNILSFRAAIIYFVFCSFIFNPTLTASLFNAI